MPDELHQTVQQHTTDIQELAITVARLATIAENNEKRRDEDVTMLKEAISGINELRKEVGAALSLEASINDLKDRVSESREDIRTAKHDLGNVSNQLLAIPTLIQKISDIQKQNAVQDNEIQTLKSWRDEIKGATKATVNIFRAGWAVGGGVVVAGVVFLIKMCLAHYSGGGAVTGF